MRVEKLPKRLFIMPDVTCGLIQLIREWFNKQEARVTHDPNIQVFIPDYTHLIWAPIIDYQLLSDTLG